MQAVGVKIGYLPQIGYQFQPFSFVVFCEPVTKFIFVNNINKIKGMQILFESTYSSTYCVLWQVVK